MEGELTHGKNYQKGSFGTNIPLTINKNIYMAKVISVEDDYNVGRIKVFIDGIDISNDNLPYVYPLMSRIVHIMPKVGELVLVFFADSKKEAQSQKLSNRFWIGPIISNYESIDFDTQDLTATQTTLQSVLNPTSLLTYTNFLDPLQSKSRNKKNTEINIFPVDNTTPPLKAGNLDEVTIIGRNNTDITQSENKIKLRAGKHKKNKPDKENTINPVYSVLEFIDENTSYGLTAGDEIYLVSHKGRFKFKKTLTKDDIADLKENSQSMLYGELTVQYLKVLTEVFLNHIHSHPGKPPTYGATSPYKMEDLRKQLQNIENLLAKNLKIN
jgi:hypothetical protein